MRGRDHLVIVAKAPRAGRAKRRLGADIGSVRAAFVYRHMLGAMVRRLGGDPRWRTWLAVTPDGAVNDPAWPAHVSTLAQGDGDLGARMARVMASRPPGRVVLTGSDIPNVPAASIARVFAALGRADVVLGPARDGGFWLVGVRQGRMAHTLFDGVRWSGAHALEDTLANASHLAVETVETRGDIDTGGDLARWAGLGRSGF